MREQVWLGHRVKLYSKQNLCNNVTLDRAHVLPTPLPYQLWPLDDIVSDIVKVSF